MSDVKFGESITVEGNWVNGFIKTNTYHRATYMKSDKPVFGDELGYSKEQLQKAIEEMQDLVDYMEALEVANKIEQDEPEKDRTYAPSTGLPHLSLGKPRRVSIIDTTLDQLHDSAMRSNVVKQID